MKNIIFNILHIITVFFFLAKTGFAADISSLTSEVDTTLTGVLTIVRRIVWAGVAIAALIIGFRYARGKIEVDEMLKWALAIGFIVLSTEVINYFATQ